MLRARLRRSLGTPKSSSLHHLTVEVFREADLLLKLRILLSCPYPFTLVVVLRDPQNGT